LLFYRLLQNAVVVKKLDYDTIVWSRRGQAGKRRGPQPKPKAKRARRAGRRLPRDCRKLHSVRRWGVRRLTLTLMSRTASEVSIRTLLSSDLDLLFDPRFRQLGEEWLERQARDEVYVAVAELEQRPVARVSLDFVSHLQRGAAHLWAAHTEPGFQSRGIGTTLLLHLEGVARARGFDRIRLEVAKENGRAQRLYERLGYDVCGKEKSQWSYRDGDRIVEVSEDRWAMEKNIAKASH
jgi:ribosomal protein S18 acetylase RimI-like enzyme